MSRFIYVVVLAVVLIAIKFWLVPKDSAYGSFNTMNELKSRGEGLSDEKPISNIYEQHNSKERNAYSQKCDLKIETKLIDYAWKTENTEWLLNKISQLSEQTPKPILDRMYIGSGIGLHMGRVLAEKYDAKFKPRYANETATMIDPMDMLKLNDMVEKNDLDAIKEFILTRSNTKSKAIITDNGLVYVLGFLLSNLNNNSQILDTYLSSKLPIEMLDLVIASQLGIDVERLSKMYEQSSLDASVALKNFGVRSSLVLESLQHLKYEQARYWMNMGSPIKPDNFYDNALDVLVKKAPEQTSEQWRTMAIDLLDEGASPYWPRSIKKLQHILGNDIYAQYSLQLKPYQQQLNKKEKNKARVIELQIHQHILKNSAHLIDDVTQQSKCFKPIGKILVKALVNHEVNKRIKARKDRPRRKPLSIERKRIEALIAEAEEKFDSREEVERFLGGDQLVENKRAVEKYRLKTYVDDAKSLALQFPRVEPVAEDVREIMNRIMELANEGKWEEAVALLKQQDIPPQELLDTLMMVAIYSPPDLAITQQLLDEGAKVPEDAINWFARKNDVARAKQMLPYGLKLYVRKGHLSSSILAIKSKSFDIFKFMLENGVNLDVNDMSMDELDYALINYTRDPNGPRFINLLFEHGAKVENSHRQLVEDIQRKDFVAHANLIVDWPQLGKQEG